MREWARNAPDRAEFSAWFAFPSAASEINHHGSKGLVWGARQEEAILTTALLPFVNAF
jgi:hypothetical protein